MTVLILEDNLLVGEMLRLAVEDAHLSALGPVATLKQGEALIDDPSLAGALLDVQIGGDHSFPIARSLKSKGVPFIFVSGHERAILPSDLRDEVFVAKPVMVEDIARLASDRFVRHRKGDVAEQSAGQARIQSLRLRIAQGEDRIARQRRRLERLQVGGFDPRSAQITADILDQMQIAVDLMRQTVRALDGTGRHPFRIERPISDELVELNNARSIEFWSARLAVTPEQLLRLVTEVGPSVHSIRRAISLAAFEGPAARSSS